MKNLETRINELEMKYSYQDDLVSELNKMVAQQSLEIERLQQEMKELKDSGDGPSTGPTNLYDEVPPHY